METKRREQLIVDDQFLVEIIDDKTPVYVPGQRWGVAFAYDPLHMMVIRDVPTMGLLPLKEHEADLRALIKATV